MGIEIFENNERILINSIMKGTKISQVEKSSIINTLDFGILMCAEDDVRELTENTREKINLLTDEQWDKLRKQLPFDCVEGSDETMEADNLMIDENGIVVEIN